MGTLHVASKRGDDTMTWEDVELVADVEAIFADAEKNDIGRIKDANDAYGVALVEVEFRKVKALGYRTHKTSSATDTANDAVITHKFDMEAAAIFAFPATVGG